MKLPPLKRLSKDPFLVLIAVVVMVPAVLAAYGIAHQPSQNVVSSATTPEASANSQVAGRSNTATADTPKPITQAEQTLVAEESLQTESATVPGQTCDQAKKSAAEAAKSTQISQENVQHEQQQDKITSISKVYRKYWDDEQTRHQEALREIEATFQTALATASC